MFITVFTKPLPTYPYCEPHQPMPNYHFLKINSNVIFPSTPLSSKCLFPSGSPTTTLYAPLPVSYLECISLNVNGSKQSLLTSAWLVASLLPYFPQEGHMIACLLLNRQFPGVSSLFYRGFSSLHKTWHWRPPRRGAVSGLVFTCKVTSGEQFALNNSALVKEHYQLTHLIQLRSSPCQFVTTTTDKLTTIVAPNS